MAAAHEGRQAHQALDYSRAIPSLGGAHRGALCHDGSCCGLHPAAGQRVTRLALAQHSRELDQHRRALLSRRLASTEELGEQHRHPGEPRGHRAHSETQGVDGGGAVRTLGAPRPCPEVLWDGPVGLPIAGQGRADAGWQYPAPAHQARRAEAGNSVANWLVLRRSFATWLAKANVLVTDAQALMRHSRASLTLDVYQQFIPESQRRAVEQLPGMVPAAVPDSGPLLVQ